jgi:hypothetical protein
MAYIIHLEIDVAYSLAELMIASSRGWATSGEEWGSDTWTRTTTLVPVCPCGLIPLCAAHALPCRTSSLLLVGGLLPTGVISWHRLGYLPSWNIPSSISMVCIRWCLWHVHRGIPWHALHHRSWHTTPACGFHWLQLIGQAPALI